MFICAFRGCPLHENLKSSTEMKTFIQKYFKRKKFSGHPYLILNIFFFRINFKPCFLLYTIYTPEKTLVNAS